MAGGNRAYTLTDILGQLNGEIASNGNTTTPIEVNQLVVASEVLGYTESASAATTATSFKWDAAGAYWGTLPWQ